MATTKIIQTVELIKQSYHQNCCSRVSNLKPQDKITIESENVPKQEEICSKPKYSLNESDSIRQVRIRSLSHWPHFTPSCESMASAGWFACHVKDRVICIYCNTI